MEAPSAAARWWFGVTAAVALSGVLLQMYAVTDNRVGHFTTPAARAFNILFFFTVASNVIVGVTCAMLARGRRTEGRAFAVARLTGVVAITVTGVVYHGILADLTDLKGLDVICNEMLHTIVPVLAVAGWLIFGPRGGTSNRIAVLTLIFPILWLTVTLVRGEIVDWYPYPFVDVGDLGYARVLLNCALVAVLFIGLAFGAMGLDRWLTARAGGGSTPGPRARSDR